MISTYLEFWNMALGKNDPVFRVFMIIWLVIYTLSWIYFVVAYVLTCLSLHTIAKRRGVLHPWLAWIPVGNLWILGSISDRYQSVVNGKQRKFRIRLMLLSVAVIVTYALAALFSVHMIDTVDTVNTFSKIALVIAYMGFLFASVAAVITTAVFGYICLYDVYKSCAPRQTMTYLMLSIFVNVTVPFFLFRCRELELGMAAKEEKTGQIGDCAEEHDLL
jgi:hypothetical protein